MTKKVKRKERKSVRRTMALARGMKVGYWPKGNGKRFDKARRKSVK